MSSSVGVVVGSVEGRTRLAVKGRVCVKAGGVVLGSLVLVLFAGKSHIVLLVSSCHFDLRMVVVTLLTRSAVPICPFPPKLKPHPRFGLFVSPIVLAAVLITALRSIRSCNAGVARAAGVRMIAVNNIVWGIE